MPELPEVETTRQSILPQLEQQQIKSCEIRQHRLRWPVDKKLAKILPGLEIQKIARRGKYLLLWIKPGCLLIHLGMSGHLRVLQQFETPGKHDHIDLTLDSGKILRFTDPRRFGAWLWTTEPPEMHPLLAHLGPEPLTHTFTADYLAKRAQGRQQAIKQFIMDSKIVVGVGNIYANEALFYAGLHPQLPAGQLSLSQHQRLVKEIRRILRRAIQRGGTTLRNFLHGTDEGKPGYFKQELQVYGRQGQACHTCQTGLIDLRLGHRATVFCPNCQPG